MGNKIILIFIIKKKFILGYSKGLSETVDFVIGCLGEGPKKIVYK